MPTTIGLGLAMLAIAPYTALWTAAILVRLLAERNLFWTLVTEPTAKAIVINGVVAYLLMSHMGRHFAGPQALTDPATDVADQWNIVPEPAQNQLHLSPEGIRKFLPSFKGIRWIGMPPGADAYQYVFEWGSLEEHDNNGVTKSDIKWNEKTIDYIILQEDVYATKLDTVECKDNIPLNSIILISGRVINPYKALFRIERWLEAVRNMVGSKMRDFYGLKKYKQLVSLKQSKKKVDASDVMPQELHDFFEETIKWIADNWGFQISFIRIYSLDPGSDLATRFIKASTEAYVAEQEADADVERGRGLAARDKEHFGAIAGITGGVEMFKWRRIGESGLTTYVEGGGAIPAISVGGQGASPNRQTPTPSGAAPATPVPPVKP